MFVLTEANNFFSFTVSDASNFFPFTVSEPRSHRIVAQIYYVIRGHSFVFAAAHNVSSSGGHLKEVVGHDLPFKRATSKGHLLEAQDMACHLKRAA